MKTKINDWYPETKSLLYDLQAAGLTLVEGDNGDDKFKFTVDIDKFISNLTACDETHLVIHDDKLGRNRWLFLVYGNNPGELVNDYSVPRDDKKPEGFVDRLDAVTTAHYDKWELRGQPMKWDER